MKVIIEHEHKCERIATAPGMSEGREWWVGKLKEKIPEYPQEEYCLHLKTPVKDVTFLCNEGDFAQLQILCMCITGKLNDVWIDSMIKIAKTIN